ncbi:MAG: tripartite tricarboxylate transporter substrate binding protein [Burkholderiales bacterium]|nr:tripartite tricarboxylate transporter substrate binding protein [Burkholderiales bacterium]
MLKRLLAATALALAATGAAAQGFPTRPVTLIVPWPPGGSTDIAMRALAEATQKHLGQPIVVENRPGAGGTLGAVALLKAPPDGYTLTQIPLGVFRVPHLQPTPYNPLTDFTYVIGISGYTFGVVVRADAPWKTWGELVAWAKANPDKVSYGTPGANTSLHITMEDIAFTQGIRWTHVPYKGNAENMTALLGGHIDVAADSTGWGPQVDAGKMRLLVTWGANRTKRWPNVPTLKELGFGIVSNSPYGIAGPKGMDPQVVRILHDAFKKGMEDPIHLQALEKLDQELVYMSSEDYAKFARDTFNAEKATMDRLKAQTK